MDKVSKLFVQGEGEEGAQDAFEVEDTLALIAQVIRPYDTIRHLDTSSQHILSTCLHPLTTLSHYISKTNTYPFTSPSQPTFSSLFLPSLNTLRFTRCV